MLARPDLVRVWGERRQRLQDRVAEVMALWEETVRTMPSVRNIALRDTLESIGTLPRVYDAFFRAHEVPVSVDYPLSVPVDESLQGLDYLEVWLTQLLAEARFLARFNVNDMVAYLQSWCPDYQGLIINLYEPIRDAWKAGKLPMVGEWPRPERLVADLHKRGRMFEIKRKSCNPLFLSASYMAKMVQII